MIHFRAREIPSENRVAIEVSDSGEGIEPSDLERIFLPFEQAMHRTQRKEDSGLGLGLAIAKSVVELHSGEIVATSHGRGRGSTFTVELPVCEASRKVVDTTAPVVPSHGSSPPLKILLVEDHDDTGRIMTRLLQAVGYDVKHAETAAAGFSLLTENDFDLIVSDLGLPDESGLSLMTRIREVKPGIPGICLSGYGTDEDLQACKNAGFSEHLTKPVDISRLEATIQRLTGRGRVSVS